MRPEHISQSRNPACCQSLDWSCGDCIDTNLLWSQIIRQIAHATFQCRLGDAHHVVVRHYFLGAEICHRDDAATIFHKRRCGTGQGNQRIDTYVVRYTKAFAGSAYEISLEFFCWRESHAVYQHVQFPVAFFELCEDPFNVLVFRNIAHEGFGAGKGQNQVFGFLLETLVLVGDRQLSARLMQSLSDRPGNASFVGDSEDDGYTAFEAERHRFSWS